MALRNRSLFLYNLQIDTTNASIDFKAVSGGPTLQATLRLGYYSLATLCTEIERAMQAADPDHEYTISANRSIAAGLQNRVTIASSSAFLSLLFASGPRAASSIAAYIGFNGADYTGATTYTGYQSAGTVLIPDYVGYNYLGPEFNRKVFGAVNVSTSGVKEAIVFQIQEFITVTFRFETQTKWINEWRPMIDWLIEQKDFDFTPDYTDPETFYTVTLESSEADGQGLGFTGREMLPDFPFYYETGEITLRVRASE